MYAVTKGIYRTGYIVLTTNALLRLTRLRKSLSFQALDQIFAAVVNLEPVRKQEDIDRIDSVFDGGVARLRFYVEAAFFQQR